MKLIFATLKILCLSLLLTACSKTNKEGRYIPKNVALAMVIHPQSLSEKLPWEEIRKNEMFRKLYADSSVEAYMKTVMDNPENTGIDIKQDLIVFLHKDSLGSYSALEGAVKDEAKFKQFNTSTLKGKESEKDGTRYIRNDKMLSSWRNGRFVIMINLPDPQVGSDKPSLPARDLTANVNAIYALKEDGSLGKDEKFTDLMKIKADLHFWGNAAIVAENTRELGAMPMVNLSKLYEDSYYAGAVNCENGKIAVDIRSYSSKEMTDLNRKYAGAKINSAMLRRMPADEVIMLAAFSFKTEGLKAFVNMLGIEGFVNIGAGQLGFTFEDFLKANKGDIAFSVSSKDSAGAPLLSAVFAASIADKKSFGKLMEAGNKAMATVGDKIPKLYTKSSNDFFALGTDEAITNNFISKESNGKFDFVEKSSGEPMLFYVNIPRALHVFSSRATRDSLETIAAELTAKMWDNVIMTGGGFDDGAIKMHAEINLVDKNTNSLKQLNGYFARMADIQQQITSKRTKWMEKAMQENQADSLNILMNDSLTQ